MSETTTIGAMLRGTLWASFAMCCWVCEMSFALTFFYAILAWDALFRGERMVDDWVQLLADTLQKTRD